LRGRLILDVVDGDLGTVGVAGERTTAKIVYLALMSRLLLWSRSKRPVSPLIRGTSSSGKSFMTSAAL